MAGEIPRGRERRAGGEAGARPPAEDGRPAAVPALRPDRRPGPAADAVRVRAVDPGDGPRGDPPRIRRPAERGFRRPPFAETRALAAAAFAPRLSAEPRGRRPVEARGVPRDPG